MPRNSGTFPPRPLTRRQELLVLKLAHQEPLEIIAERVDRSPAFVSKLIRFWLGGKQVVRRWHKAPETVKPRKKLDALCGGAPVCDMGHALHFDTDWIGRTLQWCPTCQSTPSTCGPRRAA